MIFPEPKLEAVDGIVVWYVGFPLVCLKTLCSNLTHGQACGLPCGLPAQSITDPQGDRTFKIRPEVGQAGFLDWDAQPFYSLSGGEAWAASVSYDFYYAENRHINFRSFEKCGPVIRVCVCPDARWHWAREVQG
jgi:hypothetical protein